MRNKYSNTLQLVNLAIFVMLNILLLSSCLEDKEQEKASMQTVGKLPNKNCIFEESVRLSLSGEDPLTNELTLEDFKEEEKEIEEVENKEKQPNERVVSVEEIAIIHPEAISEEPERIVDVNPYDNFGVPQGNTEYLDLCAHNKLDCYKAGNPCNPYGRYAVPVCKAYKITKEICNTD